MFNLEAKTCEPSSERCGDFMNMFMDRRLTEAVFVFNMCP